ncbi:uncharacterized protein [Littorina saxatilis]|uniref:uncharacterized protein n=1 Tax=Littorina saxatilis TaxID=31220 RepID=UPI0038B48947
MRLLTSIALLLVVSGSCVCGPGEPGDARKAKQQQAPNYTAEFLQQLLETIQRRSPIPAAERTLNDKRLYNQISKYNLKVIHTYIPFLEKNDVRVVDNDNAIFLSTDEIPRGIDYVYRKHHGEGARKIYHRMKKNYFGIGEFRIQKALNSMELRQQTRPVFKNKPKMKTILAHSINERHQIDLVDLDSVTTGNRYVVAILDVFSRYLWLRSSEQKNAKSVASVVFKVYEEWGSPRIIQCDNGGEFKGEFEAQAVKHGIRIIRGSPSHPQSQGKVERSHRPWKSKIMFDLVSKHVETSNFDRDLFHYQNDYNTAFHESINMTPRECQFQQLQIQANKQMSADEVRKAIVQFLRRNPVLNVADGVLDLRDRISDETWEQYLDRMEKGEQWGDENTLLAVPFVFDVPVTVLSDSMDHVVYIPLPNQHVNEDVPTLLIGHISELHYVGLIPVDSPCIEVNENYAHSDETLCEACGMSGEHDCLEESLTVSMGKPHAIDPLCFDCGIFASLRPSSSRHRMTPLLVSEDEDCLTEALQLSASDDSFAG